MIGFFLEGKTETFWICFITNENFDLKSLPNGVPRFVFKENPHFDTVRTFWSQYIKSRSYRIFTGQNSIITDRCAVC